MSIIVFESVLMQKEKGAVQLLLVILLIVGLVVVVYLVGQKTNIFPKAYSPSPTTLPANLIKQSEYQNPFDETISPTPVSGNTNIFSGYKNPFDNLK